MEDMRIERVATGRDAVVRLSRTSEFSSPMPFATLLQLPLAYRATLLRNGRVGRHGPPREGHGVVEGEGSDVLGRWPYGKAGAAG